MCGQCDDQAKRDDERAKLEGDYDLVRRARAYLSSNAAESGAYVLIDALAATLEEYLPDLPREEWPSVMDGAVTPFAENH
jgi:hypothetical protein